MYRSLQEAAAKALSMDTDWMDSLDEIYTRRKKIAQAIMTEVGAVYEVGRAGLFVWAKVKDQSRTVAELCDEILYQTKVIITPGHINGRNGEGYIRISLCSSEEVLQEALERIKAVK